jgi:hypothetical protein
VLGQGWRGGIKPLYAEGFVKRVVPYVLAGAVAFAAGYFLAARTRAPMAELERISLELRLCQEKLPK